MRFVFAILIFCLGKLTLYSQLDHYWGQVYNPESALLSGAVVSGHGASGGGFYNPATMSFVESSSFSVNFNLVSTQSVSLENALGEGKDIQTLQFVLRPRFFAFLIKPEKFDDRVVIEAFYMNRNNFEMELDKSYVERTDVLSRYNGEENYNGGYKFQQYYDEHMYGLAFSKKMNSHFSIGTTGFLMYKSQRMFEELSIKATPQSFSQVSSTDQADGYEVVSYLNREIFNFYNYRFLIKFGLNYSREKFGLGLVLTMPSIGVAGGGDVERTYEVSNVDVDVDGEPSTDVDLLINDAQYDLDASFKDPFSISLGAHYQFGKVLLTGTVQYLVK